MAGAAPGVPLSSAARQEASRRRRKRTATAAVLPDWVYQPRRLSIDLQRDRNDFKVLTWNVNGLRVLCDSVEGLGDAYGEKTRVEEIARFILGQNPDMVALQEVFCTIRGFALPLLRERYMIFERDEESTVVILLKREWMDKMIGQEFVPFTNSQNRRGLLKIALELRPGEKTYLVTTWLQGGAAPKTKKKRIAQYKEMFIHAKKMLDEKAFFVLCGDFNMRQSELSTLQGPLPVMDVWTMQETERYKINQGTWRAPWNLTETAPYCRFDRLYISPGGAIQCSNVRLLYEETVAPISARDWGTVELSDHFPLLAELKI